ncbi:methyl-accepting chemotaxis protein [Halorubellus sp. PRR65]|uniref:methyl-accepting chemotaxis protein n=1 Tax=Halorubellus sp. PRR65 TaxID=3098148 RepID=UPI002B25B718|nr:methyl-accepting chemotaxis protein [Halorubellus sp. PRR65]
MGDDDSGSIAATVTPEFVRRRYSVKFAVSILIVVLVIGAAGFYGYQQTKDTVETNTKSQLREASDLRAAALSGWTESIRDQTRSVSAGESLRASGDADSYLQTEQSRLSDDILGIHLVNSSTNSVMASTDPIAGFELSKLGVPWANAQVTSGSAEASDRVWVSSSSYESPLMPYTRGQVVAFASAVPNADDRYVVVVTRIQSRLDTVKGGETAGRTQIVNASGGTVLDSGSQVDGSLHESALSAARESGDPQFQEAGGEVHAYSRVDGTDWVAMTSVDTAQAFQVRNAVLQYVAFIVLSALGMLAVGAVVLGRQTVTPLARLRDRASEMEDGELNVDLQSNRVDEIGRLYGAFASMRDSLRDQIQEAEMARERAETAREEAEQLNRHLERKADEYSDVMGAVSDGNLTARMDTASENEAMTEIAREFNEMIAEIDRTVANLRTFATEVAGSSEEVTASSEEVQSASRQVSESVQSISDGAERQNEQFQAVSGEMESLSTTTEEIAATTNEVADIAERTAETGREGRAAAEAAIDGMTELESGSKSAVSAIEDLEAEMAQIDELIEFIADIAKETNMLALNANIEASRGGSEAAAEDEGFAVVAQEVKELASETKEAADDIEARLESIQHQTDETVSEVQWTANQVAANTERVEEAASALDEIAEYAAETNRGVQEISATTEQQAASTQEVVAMVSEAATISEETTSEAENVAAAAEEQTASLSEVTESAGHLAQRASQLSRALDRFDTQSSESADDGFVAETEAAVEFDTDAVAADDADGDGAFPDDGERSDASALADAAGDASADGSDATVENDDDATSDDDASAEDGDALDDDAFEFGTGNDA